MYKKYMVFIIFIIICIAIVIGVNISNNTYIYQEDGTIQDSNGELVNHLKDINNIEEKKNQVQFFLEYNLLTNEEAKELLE